MSPTDNDPEMTPAEVREVLTLLSVEEFGSENPTVRAVSEAAGVERDIVEGLLTRIRHDAQQREEDAAEAHRHELARLDREVERLKDKQEHGYERPRFRSDWRWRRSDWAGRETTRNLWILLLLGPLIIAAVISIIEMSR